MYPENVREQARIFRKQGFTHREIAKRLDVSLCSAYLWVRGIVITPGQKHAILERARESAFTPERREELRQSAKIRLAPYREKYTKEILLQKIIDFYKKHGRIPLKREFNLYREYQKRFGSWNNAIHAAGFDINPVLFAKKFTANDGHPCDSFTEKIIDDWLYKQRIYHKRHIPYPGTRMTADFSLGPKVILEFFGLAGVQKRYDELLKRKRQVCREHSIHLIEIYPRHLLNLRRIPRRSAARMNASGCYDDTICRIVGCSTFLPSNTVSNTKPMMFMQNKGNFCDTAPLAVR